MTTGEWIGVGQLIVAALGIIAVLVTIWQKIRSDNRAEWWRRYTWATEQSTARDIESRLVGWINLEILGYSRLLTSTEKALVKALAMDDKRWDNGR